MASEVTYVVGVLLALVVQPALDAASWSQRSRCVREPGEVGVPDRLESARSLAVGRGLGGAISNRGSSSRVCGLTPGADSLGSAPATLASSLTTEKPLVSSMLACRPGSTIPSVHDVLAGAACGGLSHRCLAQISRADLHA